MQKVKKIKRVDWAIASKLFYCQYALEEILDENSLFMTKLNDLVGAVFNTTRKEYKI